MIGPFQLCHQQPTFRRRLHSLQSRCPHQPCDDHLQLTTSAATMFAARQRAVCAARQLQRTCRTYASEAHGHGHGHHSSAPVSESFGVRPKSPYLALSTPGERLFQMLTGRCYRKDPLSRSARSWAPFSSSSSALRRARPGTACSQSTDQRPRTGRPSTLCTPRPRSRLATTEICLRTHQPSARLSTSHTPST